MGKDFFTLTRVWKYLMKQDILPGDNPGGNFLVAS